MMLTLERSTTGNVRSRSYGIVVGVGCAAAGEARLSVSGRKIDAAQCWTWRPVSVYDPSGLPHFSHRKVAKNCAISRPTASWPAFHLWIISTEFPNPFWPVTQNCTPTLGRFLSLSLNHSQTTIFSSRQSDNNIGKYRTNCATTFFCMNLSGYVVECDYI